MDEPLSPEELAEYAALEQKFKEKDDGTEISVDVPLVEMCTDFFGTWKCIQGNDISDLQKYAEIVV